MIRISLRLQTIFLVLSLVRFFAHIVTPSAKGSLSVGHYYHPLFSSVTDTASGELDESPALDIPVHGDTPDGEFVLRLSCYLPLLTSVQIIALVRRPTTMALALPRAMPQVSLASAQ